MVRLRSSMYNPDGMVTPSHTLPLPAATAPRRKAEIPSGLALSADNSKLYVCANLSNRLLELDSQTGKLLRTFEVGVAPYDVCVVDGRVIVSNWGGRRPGKDDATGPAGRGTTVRVDARNIASEGSVSIIDLTSGEVVAEIVYRATCQRAGCFARQRIRRLCQRRQRSLEHHRYRKSEPSSIRFG